MVKFGLDMPFNCIKKLESACYSLVKVANRSTYSCLWDKKWQYVGLTFVDLLLILGWDELLVNFIVKTVKLLSSEVLRLLQLKQ